MKARLAATAFDGLGAKRYGGRWNSPGTRVVYVAERLSLAILEVLVHLEDPDPLHAYSSIEIEFEDALVIEIDRRVLPNEWRRTPAPIELSVIGDEWVRQRRSAILKVPSALVPQESNFLLNPEHPDFGRIQIGLPLPFKLDPRLIMPKT